MMRTLVGVTLALMLIGAPVVAAQRALSFAVELCAGTLAAAVPFYSTLYRTSEASRPFLPSRFAEPSTGDILLGLAVPPLLAGAAIATTGSLFDVTTTPLAVLATVIGASVSEIFAIQFWRLDVPEWMKTIAVPVIASLGGTIAFNRQARSSRRSFNQVPGKLHVSRSIGARSMPVLGYSIVTFVLSRERLATAAMSGAVTTYPSRLQSASAMSPSWLLPEMHLTYPLSTY